MRKSEFIANAIKKYQTDMEHMAGANAWAEWSAEAAERAGVVWDPEKPTLPERLRIENRSGGSRALIRWTEGTNWTVAEVRVMHQHAAPQEPYEIAMEMVRRYNMMPALRALAEEIASRHGLTVTLRDFWNVADRLLSILDGEEKNS